MKRLPVVVVLGIVVGHLVLHAPPAYACSCRADVLVADALAESDAAFVGVFTGREDPLVQGELIFSGRPVVNHFEVERTVKGNIGGRVDVEAAASGASCGLELEVGDRTGLFLEATGTGWRSSLCSQTDSAGLLAFAPVAATAAETDDSLGGLSVAFGVLAVAVAGYFVVDRVRRRSGLTGEHMFV